VFVLPNGKQHSRSNLRKGEQDEDYGNHNRETTDSHQNQIGSLRRIYRAYQISDQYAA